MSDRGSILVVSPYRGEYGPARVLEHVLRALVAAGYRPVCAVPPGARETAEMKQLAVAIHHIDALATFPRTLDLFRLVRFFFRHLDAAHELERLARAEDVRAVYSVSEAVFAAGLAARRVGVPSVTHAIGMSIGSPRWSARVYIGFLNRLTDRFIAVSSAVADMFGANGVPDDKVTVVHNGIEVADLNAAQRGDAPFTHAGPTVGMFAAYDPRKGHELFVEAARLVAAERPDVRFFLIGGVLEEQRESVAFERRIESRLRELDLIDRFGRPGYVPAPRIYDWMRALDVVVAPSRTEAFAHALLEAMACGRPIVATAIEGNLDAFVHGRSGLYVPRDARSLADAVLSLLNDRDAAEAMGAAAARRVAAFFDVSVTIPAIGHAVARLLDRRAPAPPVEVAG